MQAHRIALVGDGADPTLSASVPGILYARGCIDQQQYDAGMRLRSLHAALYGTPWPRPSWGGEISEPTLIEIQQEFDAKVSRLDYDQRQVLTNVCVFDCLPNWFLVSRTPGLLELPEDRQERQALLTGLDALLDRVRGRAA